VDPSNGQTITLGSTETGVWTQTWELSVLAGDRCTGAHTLHGQFFVNGKTYNLLDGTEVYILSTGVMTEVATWSNVSYATLTPQTATIVPKYP
jgi:hypothetical protein